MWAPTILNCLLKSISIYFPNLDELSFLVVFAFPIASMIGDDAKTRRSTFVSLFPSFVLPSLVPPTVAKYRIAYLALTVLPAPDSPETMIDWSCVYLKRKFSIKSTWILCARFYNWYGKVFIYKSSQKIPFHSFESLFCHGIDMRIKVAHILSSIHRNRLISIYLEITKMIKVNYKVSQSFRLDYLQ